MGEVKRKIASWEEYQADPEWFATLECGHTTPKSYESGDGLNEAQKAKADAAGELVCYECSRLDDEIARKEAELAALKATRKGPASPDGSVE